MSPRPGGLADVTQTAKKRQPQQKQQQQRSQKPKAETNGSDKRQATIPSQKARADHELQREGAAGELAARVGQLSDKSDACKEKIRSKLDEFSRRGGEIKDEIAQALERQAGVLASRESVADSVDQLRNRMLELSQQPLFGGPPEAEPEQAAAATGPEATDANDAIEATTTTTATTITTMQLESQADMGEQSPGQTNSDAREPDVNDSRDDNESGPPAELGADEQAQEQEGQLIPGNCFEPLTARLDPKTKFLTLRASLERHFVRAPELLEPICSRLLMLSRRIDALVHQNDRNQAEIAKLTLVKTKLSDLCRELQKANGAIRVESLDLIRGEQRRAREQAAKIQATLASVMKLFDESQQRNLALKQENVELQSKLRALLDHCNQWEKCVETALKQRDIENCLLKAELKRLQLVRTEDEERFVKEKQGLLRMVELMRSHQAKIEDKETALRAQLASYASKYDECQEIIQKGLGKFQVESKRMLKQIEGSRHDYVQLLGKYEASNKKIKELLEEKQTWARTLGQADRKVEALERLCRSLKQDNDKLAAAATTDAGAAATANQGEPVAGLKLELELEPERATARVASARAKEHAA